MTTEVKSFRSLTSYLTPTRTENLVGVRTFVHRSETNPEAGYYVKRIALPGKPVRYICTCDDWFHRRGPLDQDCKHIETLKAAIRIFGLRAFPRGRQLSTSTARRPRPQAVASKVRREVTPRYPRQHAYRPRGVTR